MPFVEFIAGRQLPETVAYQPDGQTTLLELARLEELPLHWRCGLGTCGTCAVRLTLIAGTAQPLSNKERNVLTHHAKPLQPLADGSQWRLSCSYILDGADLRAAWE